MINFNSGINNQVQDSLKAQNAAKQVVGIAYAQGILPGSPGWQNFIKSDPKVQQIMSSFGGLNYMRDKVNDILNRPNANQYAEEFNRAEQTKQYKDLTQKSFDEAGEFQKNMPGYIQGEVGALRKSLSEQLAGAQGAIRQQQNARGMLYSGQKQKKEGEAKNLAAQTFNQGASDIALGAQKQADEMSARASAIKRGGAQAQAGYNDIVNRASEARKSASDALSSQYSSLLGSGLGTAIGSSKLSTDQNKIGSPGKLGSNIQQSVY